MKKKTEEDYETKLSNKWEFSISGPVHLTSVDWRELDHKKSVVASLVQGVYMLEMDRQRKRTGHKALAPSWWNFFHFQCIKVLVDRIDSSIFGAIFEYNPHAPNNQHGIPPRYVIVFRGTIMEPPTRKRDLYLDIQIPLNGLTRDSRYQIAIQEIQGMSAQMSPITYLGGHSLGAAIALQAGKDMAKKGCHIETFLYNPPYPSYPIEKINDPYMKDKIRIAKSVVTAGVYHAFKKDNRPSNSTQQYNPFLLLCSWVPNLFVNPRDPFCCEYIGHFEHRGRMKILGKDEVDVIATKTSLLSMLAAAFGRDCEPLHLIPSALLTKNMMVDLKQSVKEAYCLDQWWKPYTHWHSKLYMYGKQ